jgi:hypothetical protein
MDPDALDVSCSEGGSTVKLLFLDTISVEDAIAVANSLIVVDDAAWEALLFPCADVDAVVTSCHPNPAR